MQFTGNYTNLPEYSKDSVAILFRFNPIKLAKVNHSTQEQWKIDN